MASFCSCLGKLHRVDIYAHWMTRRLSTSNTNGLFTSITTVHLLLPLQTWEKLAHAGRHRFCASIRGTPGYPRGAPTWREEVIIFVSDCVLVRRRSPPPHFPALADRCLQRDNPVGYFRALLLLDRDSTH